MQPHDAAPSGVDPAELPDPEWGDPTDGLLRAAACSQRVRTQTLGEKARLALFTLQAQVKREQAIAEHEAQIARLKRGED